MSSVGFLTEGSRKGTMPRRSSIFCKNIRFRSFESFVKLMRTIFLFPVDTERIGKRILTTDCWKMEALLSEFVIQAVSDMSMRDYIKSLLEEIGTLKTDLKKTVEAFQTVAEAYRVLEEQSE